jgi:general secretion pathway protein H
VQTVAPIRSSRTGKPRSQAGFTLLELLVVLALMGLLLAAMPAVLSSAIPGFRLKSAARQMADDLRVLHSASLTERREYAIELDAVGGRYAASKTSAPIKIPSSMTIQLRDIPYAEGNGRTPRIRFFPDGSSTGGSIGLIQGGQQYWVTVDWLTGRVSIHE